MWLAGALSGKYQRLIADASCSVVGARVLVLLLLQPVCYRCDVRAAQRLLVVALSERIYDFNVYRKLDCGQSVALINK